MTRKPITLAVARWSTRHPWWAVAVWVVFVAGALVLGGTSPTRQADQVDLGVGESGRATSMMSSARLVPPAVENILITARTGELDRAAADRVASGLTASLRALPEVADVTGPILAPRGDGVLLRAAVTGDPLSASERVGPVQEAVRAADAAAGTVRVEQTGPASIQADLDEQLGRDLSRAALLTLPVTLVILVVVFGALVMAGVPLLLAASAVAASLGLWALASRLVPDPGMVPHVVVLMGMAVGVDYSLFYVRRAREERAAGESVRSSLDIAAATSGHAVLVSGLVVITSMAGLYLTEDRIFSAMATGAILVVAVALLASLTVLPAFLAIFGDRIEAVRVPGLRPPGRRATSGRLWPVLLRPALSRPLPALLVSVALLGALAWPAHSMSLRSTTPGEFPAQMPSVQAYQRLNAVMPSQGNEYLIVARTPDGGGDVRAVLLDIASRAAADPLFTSGAQPDVATSADGRVGVVTVTSPHAVNSPEASRALRALRDGVVPAVVAGHPGLEVAVGGDTAADADYTANVMDKLPWVIGFVVVLTLVIMGIALRSVAVALTTAVLDLLSVGSAFGVLTLVFQHTWAEGLLGFTSTGHVVAWIPSFLLVVLIGLSMDYHVFIVSRVREAAMLGLSPRFAVAEGITRSAGVVTGAATVMVSVFAVFASLSFIELKQIGVGLAVAVVIDAVVIRIVLLPAIMALLGRWNWWPSVVGLSGVDGGAPALPPGSQPAPSPDPAARA